MRNMLLSFSVGLQNLLCTKHFKWPIRLPFFKEENLPASLDKQFLYQGSCFNNIYWQAWLETSQRACLLATLDWAWLTWKSWCIQLKFHYKLGNTLLWSIQCTEQVFHFCMNVFQKRSALSLFYKVYDLSKTFQYPKNVTSFSLIIFLDLNWPESWYWKALF